MREIRIPLALGQYRAFKEWCTERNYHSVQFCKFEPQGGYEYTGLNHQGDAHIPEYLICVILATCELGFVLDRIDEVIHEKAGV